MNNRLLIIIDRLAKPLYVLLNRLKWSSKAYTSENSFVALKFFGLGSITRIANVMDQTGVNRRAVTFITLEQNRSVIEILELQALYIKTGNPFSFVWTACKSIFTVWGMKNVTVLDMERASNLSGIFRLIVSIRKPAVSFYFKPNNQVKGSQVFISLVNKPAPLAIASMFESPLQSTEYLSHTEINKNRIIVNVNAGNYLPQRKFSTPEYVNLIKSLFSLHSNWQFELSGLESELDRVVSFRANLLEIGIPESNVKVIAGKHDLKSFSERLKTASLFITNDSGPLHLAYYFKVRTVAIWGPTSPDLVGYKNNESMLNLATDMNCSPCFLHPKSKVAKACNGELTCFKTMNIQEMASKISSFVHSQSTFNSI
jgi:hypothetical protein